jgi:predicted nucleic-acid-binding protein
VIAIDTNLVVRFLTRDDPAQAARAKALIDSQPVLLLKTVLLEAEWALRTVYRLDRRTIVAGLRDLAGLPRVEVEDGAAVARAFAWFDQGLDFADALHLASSGPADAFATFDRAFRRRAQALDGTTPVIAP